MNKIVLIYEDECIAKLLTYDAGDNKVVPTLYGEVIKDNFNFEVNESRNKPPLNTLKTITSSVRRYIEANYGSSAGKCLEASTFIAYLIETLIPEAKYTECPEGFVEYDEGACQYTNCPYSSHMWVETIIGDNRYYIDVTADQFNNCVYEQHKYPAIIMSRAKPYNFSYTIPEIDTTLLDERSDHLERMLYDYYIRDWSRSRGFDPIEVIKCNEKHESCCGEMFVSFDEFMSNEYQNFDYVMDLLNRSIPNPRNRIRIKRLYKNKRENVNMSENNTVIKKYELVASTDVDVLGHYLIKSLVSFDTIDGNHVNIGDFGGSVDNEKNLSQEGRCWIAEGAAVVGNAIVSGDALICSDTIVTDNAVVDGESIVDENCRIEESAKITTSVIYNDSIITGDARIGLSNICSNVMIGGDSVFLKTTMRNCEHTKWLNPYVQKGYITSPQELIVVQSGFNEYSMDISVYPTKEDEDDVVSYSVRSHMHGKPDLIIRKGREDQDEFTPVDYPQIYQYIEKLMNFLRSTLPYRVEERIVDVDDE